VSAMECREATKLGAAQLSHSDVHLWIAYLDRSPDEIGRMGATLTRDELERASAFSFERDRSRFIAARAILRRLLGQYTGCEPRSIRLDYTPWGKPVLAVESASRGIRFNLSHSHGLAVYAVAGGREVGVDVEIIRPDLVNERIAEHFFSRAEVEWLRTFLVNIRRRHFSPAGPVRKPMSRRLAGD